jgi:hypothetical protein
MAYKMRGFSGFKNVSKAKYGEKSGAFQKTYKEAYAGLSESQKKKYKSEADFINQAKLYNQKKYGTTEPTKEAKKYTGGDKQKLAEVVKPKKVVAKKSVDSKAQPKKAQPSREPSKADKITAVKREGGRGARKIAAAERKLAKAAGDTSKRGDRKRRKADKKMGKAGIA